jgi:hypothetical protein
MLACLGVTERIFRVVFQRCACLNIGRRTVRGNPNLKKPLSKLCLERRRLSGSYWTVTAMIQIVLPSSVTVGFTVGCVVLEIPKPDQFALDCFNTGITRVNIRENNWEVFVPYMSQTLHLPLELITT